MEGMVMMVERRPVKAAPALALRMPGRQFRKYQFRTEL